MVNHAVAERIILTDVNRQRAISIMAFPRKDNSYSECFYPPVEALGVEVYKGECSGRWLLKHLRNIDYIHIHWPSLFYNEPQRRKCLRKFALFLFFLTLGRLRGARLIWTIHNLYPHERCVIPQLDTLTRRLLVKLGTLFFIHGSSAEADVLREFPALAGRTVLIQHGHWIGYYPNTMTCSTARSRLGLTESEFVFLFIGLCKKYKNLEGLIRAFEQLPGNPVLVISGKFQDVAYEEAIRAAITRSRSRIILHSGFVRHEDMQIYLRACDAVTTPYNEILSSGSAILALSFGRPVIAPAIGCLKDLIVEGCGFLYDPSQQPESLRDAMRAAMVARFDEAHIMAEALKLDWRESAKIVVNSLADLRN
ncbi:MAG: glycosyltransferase [Candidatus Acidiferrales bacterium]